LDWLTSSTRNLGTLHHSDPHRWSLREILAVNLSVQSVLESVFKEEMLLESKLKYIMALISPGVWNLTNLDGDDEQQRW